MEVKKLAIIVGHEKISQGAKIVAPLNTTEYKYNTDLASIMFIMARERGLNARVFFRDNIGISGVGASVNEWASDTKLACAIELHVNSADPRASGTETLFDLDPHESKDFASIVQSKVCSKLGRTGKQNRGIKYIQDGDRGHWNLKSYKIPAVIIEPAFGSNKDDARLLWANSTGYALSLVEASIEFLGGSNGI